MASILLFEFYNLPSPAGVGVEHGKRMAEPIKEVHVDGPGSAAIATDRLFNNRNWRTHGLVKHPTGDDELKAEA